MELNKISEEIDKRLFLIVSEEIYFLNSFAKSFKKIVPNEFKDFNEYTLFADEIKFQDLILKSSNFPLMGSKQVFFIKNSSKFSKDFELHLSKLLSTNKVKKNAFKKSANRVWFIQFGAFSSIENATILKDALSEEKINNIQIDQVFKNKNFHIWMDDFDHNDFFIKIEEMDMDSLAAHARIKMNHFSYFTAYTSLMSLEYLTQDLLGLLD